MMNNATKNVDTLAASLTSYIYFNRLIKLLSDLYLAKFLDILRYTLDILQQNRSFRALLSRLLSREIFL